MAEKPNQDHHGERSREFITQQITGRNDRGKRMLKLAGKTMLVSLVFTATAVLTASALITRLHLIPFQGEGNHLEEPFHIGRDETETAAESKEQGGSEAASEAAGRETEKGAGANETRTDGTAEAASAGEAPGTAAPVTSESEARSLSMEDLVALSSRLQEAVNLADNSVASVTHLKEGKDWFDNSIQTEGVYSGVVIAKTGGELLLLTTAEAVNGADALTVHFQRGNSMSASVKCRDIPTGLAVLSLPITEENRGLLDTVEALPLGSSYRLRRGDLVMAVGAPLGIVHSADYGMISNITNGVNVTDGLASLIYVDCAGNAAGGTWVLNSDGELVGWATDVLSDARIPHTALLGISDFKDVLERMINGQASPYLGIKGTAVRKEQEAQGIPSGIYVIEEKKNSPAYEAGIQPGDILVAIGGKKVTSMREYTVALAQVGADAATTVEVMRNGRERYALIRYQLTMGAR